MKVVKVRSPFIIEVGGYGFGHTKSQVIVSIWNKGTPEPMPGDDGRYILSKSNPSETQKETYYNVSNYVKEFIENIKPTKVTGILTTYEDNNEWVYFRVAKYWYNKFTFEYVLISTDLYIGVNGFTNYNDGVNNIIDSYSNIFSNTLINKNILKTSSTLKSYINYLVEIPSGGKVEVSYYNIPQTLSVTENITGLTGIYNLKILLTQYPNNVNFADGCVVGISLKNSSNIQLTYSGFLVNSIEECKYTPVECTFINRYGGWEFLTFFKQQTNSISVKGTDYKLTQSAINYNTAIGQFKTFNLNGKQTVKLNTGFVDENYSELITDLLLSETVLLDGKPVTVKTQGSDLKTSLKDRLINYEMEFEYAYNLINDVV